MFLPSNFMEKFMQNLEEAEKTIRLADHMVYVTYPLIKEKRLLLKILTEINKGILLNINSILQYEYLYKRINLHEDAKINFDIFKTKCSKWYDINEAEIRTILELIELVKKHQQSQMEFVRREKVVILNGNAQPITITLEKIKEFLNLAKSMLEKTKTKFHRIT